MQRYPPQNSPRSICQQALQGNNTCAASSSASTSAAIAIFLNSIRKIAARASRSGGPTYIILSIRPGRNKAESMTSGRFVAARIVTLTRVSIPSISVNNAVKIRSLTLPPPTPRLVVIASISSKKMMLGLAARAFLNISRIIRSDSHASVTENLISVHGADTHGWYAAHSLLVPNRTPWIFESDEFRRDGGGFAAAVDSPRL